ncbi:predicted membrane protein [Longilinea arvoryzae]|uniref:Predicted membrane protein n=1 Tax=Longilinea arvoryzae TaxID=360412 RepID=A0A0S7BBE3_9CHLR|nr:clostripain-related cysteine peptidase [Longilinea arvoryzae]GAP15100.1 predicted membrane protein [Longilinea arvoryzae]
MVTSGLLNSQWSKRRWMAADGGKPTQRVERRRPSGPGGAPGERAEAPRRQQPSRPSGTQSSTGNGGYSGGGYTGGGGSTSGSSGPSLPSGLFKSPLGIVIVIILLALFVLPNLLNGSDGTGDQNLPTQENTEAAHSIPETSLATPTQRPTRPASVNTGDTWTVMLYQDADDQILEQDIYFDLNEAERVGSTDPVQIVAQIDRFQGAYQGDGNWTSTKRFHVTRDDDLEQIHSEEIADLGETNMSNAQTLIDFVTWAVKEYPADKYALILSDHGMGWPGGWTDPTSKGSGDENLPIANAIGNALYLNQLDQALTEIRSQTGIDSFELIGLDACLMSQIEVLTALAPHGRYAVVSEETEPSLGWAYEAFLNELNANPGMDGAALGQYIVDSYIVDDQRIQDDQARAAFVGRGSTINSLFGAASVPSAAQVSNQLSRDITLTAVDLSSIAGVNDALNNLAFTLQSADQRYVAQARSYAQSFTSIFGAQVPASYIDLGNFAQLVARSAGKRDVADASNQLMSAIQSAVVAERHGTQKAGATGIAIYFPNSNLYGSDVAGAQSYTGVAERFAQESLWDDFLAYHYSGQPFEQSTRSAVVPVEAVRAPAAGGIQISNLQLSKTSVAPGDSIDLSAEISGENIGYIKLLVGYYDSAANSIYVADSDYLSSSNTQQLNDVYYPVWESSGFNLAFTWEPVVFAITDGQTTAEALLTPESYGASPEDAVYSVDGTFTYTDSGDTRPARLYFSNGLLQRVVGFSGSDQASAPREIVPSVGDTFTISEKWLDLDSQGNVTATAYQDGKTLTFSETGLSWKQLYAAPGDYLVGFIVEDLDGNQVASYEQVQVK